MVSSIDLIAGVLTLSPLVIGYIMGIITFRIYLKGRSTLVLLSSILFFALPSPWLGVSIVFLEQVFGWKVLNATTYVFIYAWAVPVIALVWNYTSASLLKFSNVLKWVIVGIIGVIDLVFLWAIYVDRQFEVNTVPDSIFYDSSFLGLASITSIIVVASVLIFVAPLYFWISVKTADKLFSFKARFIGFGATTFAISSGMDAVLPLDSVGLIIVIRLALVISLILLFLGYNTPQSIRNRYTSE